MSTLSASRSCSRSPSRGRDRDRHARRGRYRSPTPPHRPGSRDKGGDFSRARHTHKEQFFQAHSAASEYRRDYERKRSSGGR